MEEPTMSNKMKALTRRDFLRIMGVTAAGATLAACTPAGPSGGTAPTSAPAEAQPASAGQPISLRFTSWDSASGEDVYNDVVAQFKAKFPNIDVKVEFNPDGYDDKILTGIAGGNA